MGISASELRIGNYVFDKFRNREVLVWGIESNHDRIVVNYANGSGIYTVDLKDIEPIPLTEEWLLKFGFDKEIIDSNYIRKVYYHIEDFEVEFHGKRLCLRVESQSSVRYFAHHTLYVHQLQNLYFALTGEELQLK